MTIARPIPFNRRMNGQNASHEELGRLDDQQRSRLGPLERNRFRREFAKRDVQRGDDRKCDGDRDAVGSGFRDMGGQERHRGQHSSARAGSPIHPRPMLAIVIPSCVAAM